MPQFVQKGPVKTSPHTVQCFSAGASSTGATTGATSSAGAGAPQFVQKGPVINSPHTVQCFSAVLFTGVKPASSSSLFSAIKGMGAGITPGFETGVSMGVVAGATVCTGAPIDSSAGIVWGMGLNTGILSVMGALPIFAAADFFFAFETSKNATTPKIAGIKR